MLNFNSILLSTENLNVLREFYKTVFDSDPVMEDEGHVGFLAGTTYFGIGSHDKISGKNPNPDRVLFNFETTDVKGEFERIKSLGAEVVKEPYSMGENSEFWIATLADPDGNYFQLVTPWNQNK